jgi:hypothetical protein
MIKKTIFALNSIEMKKYIGFLICLFVLSACDDGDMTFDSFDFSEVASAYCGENKLLYKINSNEALIIQINSTTLNDAFPYKSVIGTRTILIDANNKVFYRTFNDDVTGAYFCSTLPPVSPTVSSEYTTTIGGRIEITTTLSPGATTLSNATYIHSIVFKDITFTNPQGGTITYDVLTFGTYTTPSNVSFSPSFSTLPVQTCEAGRFFKVRDVNVANDADEENLNRVLEITIPQDRFPTVANDTRRVFIGEPGVSAVFRVYDGDITNEDYCEQVETLIKYEEWQAEAGVDNIEATDDIGYFDIVSNTDTDGNLVFSINLRKLTYNRTFPVDTTPGAIIGKFTTTDDNFGTISLN